MIETTEPVLRVAVGAVLFCVQAYALLQALLTLHALRVLRVNSSRERLAWRGIRDAMGRVLYAVLLMSSGWFLMQLPPVFDLRWEWHAINWGWILGGTVATINGLLAEADRRYLERDREDSVRSDEGERGA